MKKLIRALLGAGVATAFAWPGLIEVYNDLSRESPKNEFVFVRLIYENRITTPNYYKGWYTDYPTGDQNVLFAVKRTLRLNAAPESKPLRATDSELFTRPFLYTSEPGHMLLGADEALALREYVERGGFWMLDDFWGSLEWADLERELRKVFPDRQIEEVGLEHPLFHCFYNVEEVLQVPAGSKEGVANSPTWEQDGYQPTFRGIYDADGRLAVLICFNTDLMDGAEFSGNPRYPECYSSYALKVFINAIVYAMSH